MVDVSRFHNIFLGSTQRFLRIDGRRRTDVHATAAALLCKHNQS